MKKYISPTADRVRMNIESVVLGSAIEIPLGDGQTDPYPTRSQDDWSSDWTDTDE